MYTNHLTSEELERLYYSIGLPEIAKPYTLLADVEAERDELQVEIDRLVDPAQLEDAERQVKALEGTLEAAATAIDNLYQKLTVDGARMSRKAILAALVAIDLGTQ